MSAAQSTAFAFDTRNRDTDMSTKEARLAFWYEELEGADFPLVGKKNANLGEMRRAGIHLRINP